MWAVMHNAAANLLCKQFSFKSYAPRRQLCAGITEKPDALVGGGV